MSNCTASIILIACKIFVYALICLMSLCVSGAYFGDAYYASVGIFILLSTCLELIWQGKQNLLYYAAVLGIVIFGFLLLQAATKVHGCHEYEDRPGMVLKIPPDNLPR